ncbi:hypothetical protein SAMN05428989_3647 [Pseudoxanthomonas sp. GM95]|uniref:hypothetical protein n=1 Tax=Pseudoxanthomonas sp. GM95 TaxID=1881043 RepID=UPI0008B6D5A2|nr:hypothetical protein [Pseudoxanthomonas sp. GM95]SEM36524.1 hypothetical protein SAMN05428989_3647 [Pseudoxanthomonas sp. GM95]
MKTKRDFFVRDRLIQEAVCEDTWCDRCVQADLGLIDPVEYEEDGRVFVEGRCARCSAVVVTVLTERQADE